MIGEVLQPTLHEIIGDWPGDNVGHDDQCQELFGEQHDDVGNGCTENFAYSDFFGALFGGEGGEAEQA